MQGIREGKGARSATGKVGLVLRLQSVISSARVEVEDARRVTIKPSVVVEGDLNSDRVD